MGVHLDQLDRIGRGRRGHNGNQLGFGGAAGAEERPSLASTTASSFPPDRHPSVLSIGGSSDVGKPAPGSANHGSAPPKGTAAGRMVRQGQGKSGAGHLARHRPMAVPAQRHKVAHLGEGSEALILIGVQDGHDRAPLGDQRCQELGGHPFAVDDQPRQRARPGGLLVALQEGGCSLGQVQITAVRGGEEGMAFRVVQEQQRPAAQDLAGASDQAARDQVIGVHWLLVSIQ